MLAVCWGEVEVYKCFGAVWFCQDTNPPCSFEFRAESQSNLSNLTNYQWIPSLSLLPPLPRKAMFQSLPPSPPTLRAPSRPRALTALSRKFSYPHLLQWPSIVVFTHFHCKYPLLGMLSLYLLTVDKDALPYTQGIIYTIRFPSFLRIVHA